MSQSSFVNGFLKDVRTLSSLPTSKKHAKLVVPEYPFDPQLLAASSIYRRSRELYLGLGGIFHPRISSTMRSLSAQDLFADEIDFTPSFSEMIWFRDHLSDVTDPENEVEALARFNEISLFHEQNHRIIWRLLPPAPSEERDLCRYLNFAESLVVMLDLALADELGGKLSPVLERMRVIYRTGGDRKWSRLPKNEYRQYLYALHCSSYFVMELMNAEDVPAAVDYVLPGQKNMNAHAVKRSHEINELFTRVTNPQWQERYWKTARTKLKAMHYGSSADPLYLPEDPLDFSDEFFVARRVFAQFGL